MFSSPAARWTLRSRGAGWTLRARLLVMLVLLLAGVCVLIGLVTQIALHRYLVGQTDARLAGARDRLILQDRLHRGPTGLEFLNAPGLGPGTLGARVVDGQVVAAGYVPERGPIELIDPIAALNVPADGRAHTVTLGDPQSRWRLLATKTADNEVLVTGLSLEAADDTLVQLGIVEVIVAGAALLTAGVGGSAMVRLTLRPLRRVAATASRVAELPLHAGEVAVAERVPELFTDPRTEVGQVGAALNRLLGHVDAALVARQASETRLRQFVADASHELRTPLAAIRGYAELGRRSGVSEPAAVAHVLQRVESQATRMTTLVEDLLLLARLDAGRPLEHAAVDLTALVVESVGDAHVAGPEHRWRLELPDDLVYVAGDGARLHQVVANLLANARVHTPAGTTVHVGLTATDTTVRLTVADDGPGIAPDLLPHVFQRFARGDSSRSRIAGSTGLGLSIVDAVVAAHRGRVTAQSGQSPQGGHSGQNGGPAGTTFVVDLPRCSGGPVSGGEAAGLE